MAHNKSQQALVQDRRRSVARIREARLAKLKARKKKNKRKKRKYKIDKRKY